MPLKGNPFLEKTPPKPAGTPDQASRLKANLAHERTDQEMRAVDANQPGASWPRGSKGTPMIRAEMAASELIPTGQYANVSIGPARIVFLIDPDREVEGEGYFTDQERDTIARALNDAATIVESDVIAVQRSLVLEALQQQVAENGK